MATGDVTISIAVVGGVTKTVTIPTATRVLNRARYPEYGDDAAWQVAMVNKFGDLITTSAGNQQQSAAIGGLTAPTFTAAS